MKKTLIALAAFAATAGVAHAQSSVTIYGVVDAFVGRTSSETTGAAPAAKVTQSVINSNGQNNSRWGLKGVEDLGGGLQAIFGLEGGFNTDTGGFNNVSNQGGGLFGRTAYVGLNGGFGTVTLGRLYPAYDDLRGATNMIYDTNFATTGTVWGTGVQDYQNRSSNAIKYVSPDFGGFSAAISYGMGENKTATNSAENVASLHIKYANGPLLVGYAYQREKQVAGGQLFVPTTTIGATASTVVAGVTTPTTSLFSSSRKYNLLGASYDFGVAKLTGSYNTAKGATGATTSASDKEYQIGVSVPFGAAALAAGYSRSKSNATGNDNRGVGYSILGTYALSKRTNLYTGYMQTKVQNTNASNEVKASTFGVGVKHVF